MEIEIKFRAKEQSTGKWEYGSLLCNKKGVPYGMFQQCEGYCRDFEIIPETVGQYTGLKDRNERDIYGGEILGTTDLTPLGLVVFEDGCFQLKTNTHQRINHLSQERAKRLISLGNIHDNPDLIKTFDMALK